MERPDAIVAAEGLTKVEVKAKDVQFPSELRRADLSAEQTVSVTLFPSKADFERRGHN